MNMLYSKIIAKHKKLFKELAAWRNGLINSFVNHKYKRKIKDKSIYYSIQPFITGFTDQLRYFHAFYSIGAHLGLKYHHIPFRPKPLILNSEDDKKSSQNTTGYQNYGDIYDFLGFNSYFTGQNDNINLDDCQLIQIILKESFQNDFKIIQLDDMENFLKKSISKNVKPTSKRIVINIKIENDQLLRWWIRSSMNKATIGFDLLEAYFRHRKLNPWPLKFNTGKIKLMIHIRQGDTAVVKTPWNTVIQVWGRQAHSFNQLQSIDEIKDNTVTTVNDFYTFYTKLTHEFENDTLDTLLFSDGFKRSFFILDKNIEAFNLTPKQVVDLKEKGKNYDSEAFAPFESFDDLKIFIGEDPALLFDMVHSFLHADIVIFGTQQRMIPKLYSFYFRDNNGPLAISLYRNKLQRFHHLGKDWMVDNFVFVNLDNYDIKDIAKKIKDFLQKKNGNPGTLNN